MFKRAVVSAFQNSQSGVVADDCSQFVSCGSCIAQIGCGYCGNTGTCVSGGWFGSLDKSMCGLNDYYYHQCHMSTLPLGIITIVLISIAVIALLVAMGIFCCCLCCNCYQNGDMEEEDEDRPLLGTNYLRRSSTYYQWNKQPPPKQITKGDQKHDIKSTNKSNQHVDDLPESLPSTSSKEQTSKNWADRREALLKKYARDPPDTTSDAE